jgi:alanine racemase
MRAPIASLENIGAGESVGYGRTFTATQGMRLATLPVGYFEGVDRRLSGKGFVAVHGVPCPIVGRVSMNITTIDVSAFPELTLDEPATIISADRGIKNSVTEIAELCGTIPYEILVHIPAHLRRIVF